jgi:hypothetical protein
MRLGPDTLGLLHSDLEFNHFSGYYYGDRVVRAFSHTRLVGAGVSDYGSVGVMPTRPPVSPASVAQDGTRAAFKKSSETAVPGRYDVSLHSIGVNVSLVAAGPFTALHLYTNTEAAPISLQFDFAHAAGALCCLHSNQHRAASPHCAAFTQINIVLQALTVLPSLKSTSRCKPSLSLPQSQRTSPKSRKALFK